MWIYLVRIVEIGAVNLTLLKHNEAIYDMVSRDTMSGFTVMVAPDMVFAEQNTDIRGQRRDNERGLVAQHGRSAVRTGTQVFSVQYVQ